MTETALKPFFTERFANALQLAHLLHFQQRRKGSNVPYIGHLLSVAGTVIDYGGDEDVAIAALLHDAVEDQGGLEMLDQLRQQFGDRVADIIFACTDAVETPKPEWHERKSKYLARLKDEPVEVKLVSAADKLHNMRLTLSDIRSDGPGIWAKFNAGREPLLWYYSEVIKAIAEDLPTGLRNALEDTLEALKNTPAPVTPVSHDPGNPPPFKKGDRVLCSKVDDRVRIVQQVIPDADTSSGWLVAAGGDGQGIFKSGEYTGLMDASLFQLVAND